MKMLLLKDLKQNGITHEGIIDNCNVIISRKNFYDQGISSNIKRYEKI